MIYLVQQHMQTYENKHRTQLSVCTRLMLKANTQLRSDLSGPLRALSAPDLVIIKVEQYFKLFDLIKYEIEVLIVKLA